jgi:hypothetical protein
MPAASLYGRELYGAGTYGSDRLRLSSITVDGLPLDFEDILADLTIRHGRVGIFDSASPSTCTMTLLGVDRSFTRTFKLGRKLVVTATDGLTDEPRFTGRFTDATLVDDALTAVAVGRLRTLAGYTIGAAGFPVETWGARVTRAFTEAGIAAELELHVGTFNPPLVARDPEPITLDAYLGELAAMMDAAVADLPNGRVFVQTAQSRSNEGAHPIRPDEVLYAPTWAQQLPAGNVVALEWAGGVATVQDAASIAVYGPIRADIKTTFRDAVDATSAANLRLMRYAWAHWAVPDAELLAGRRLELGSPVGLTMLPSSAPFDPWSPILEGWQDTIESDGDELVWSMELALSDPRTLPWSEVPPADKWNTINAAVAWTDALTLADLH